MRYTFLAARLGVIRNRTSAELTRSCRRDYSRKRQYPTDGSKIVFAKLSKRIVCIRTFLKVDLSGRNIPINIPSHKITSFTIMIEERFYCFTHVLSCGFLSAHLYVTV
nr:MAG TPA: hypothetical protein [Caudoviricetes sp.]